MKTPPSPVRAKVSFLFLGFILLNPYQALPEAIPSSVVYVHEDGTLEIEDQKRVKLAGIEMAPEGVRVLRALVAQKSIDVDYENGEAAAQPAGYVYLATQEIERPFQAGKIPEEKRFLLNELLLKLGAARVLNPESNFKFKEEFLRAEDEARREGEGIWSYEKS